MKSVPAGTVTFLFTDIEGSTRLLQKFGDRYGELVAQHHRALRESAAASGGTEIDVQGDAFFFSFPRARDRMAGALTAQRRLTDERWPGEAEVRVRMGLHTGEPSVGEEGYLGLDVVRWLKDCRRCTRGPGPHLGSDPRTASARASRRRGDHMDLGEHTLKDMERSERLFQVVAPGLPSDFPPPRAHAAAQQQEDAARTTDQCVCEPRTVVRVRAVRRR